MVLDLILHKTDDGYTAEIPSLKGCETWAHTEESAIENAVDLAVYYLKLSSSKDVKIDKARTNKNRIVYKLVFHKAG
jgi:predicted RNase H-like HicB family nuclease